MFVAALLGECGFGWADQWAVTRLLSQNCVILLFFFSSLWFWQSRRGCKPPESHSSAPCFSAVNRGRGNLSHAPLHSAIVLCTSAVSVNSSAVILVFLSDGFAGFTKRKISRWLLFVFLPSTFKAPISGWAIQTPGFWISCFPASSLAVSLHCTSFCW